MKTILTVFIFTFFISLGIYLDSLAVGFISSMLSGIQHVWIIAVKVFLWIVLAYFTGGPIFAISFIISGAIRNSTNKK
jgi:hypothetical protein